MGDSAVATTHLLFVGGAHGYELREGDGPPPERGTVLQPADGIGPTLVVLKVGPSPLPGDRRRCAFVERRA